MSPNTGYITFTVPLRNNEEYNFSGFFSLVEKKKMPVQLFAPHNGLILKGIEDFKPENQ